MESAVVIDASALLAVILDEPERLALIAATNGFTLVSPASLPWEIGNALVATVRRRRLTAAEALQAWTVYGEIPIRLAEVDGSKSIALALDLDLYAYDAYMLQLARQRSLPLLTLDRQLRAGASAIGISLLEY